MGGLTLPNCNNHLCLSAYADDLIVIVACDVDINKLECIVQDYKCYTSATVNWGKSEDLLVGDWGGRPPSLPGGLMWRRDGLKYLGVYLGNYVIVKNWEGLVDKVKGHLEKCRWILPHLSYRG